MPIPSPTVEKRRREHELNELISTDTTQLITSLLIYRIAAKVLTPQEISNVIDGGTDSIIEQLSLAVKDKNIIEKIAKDIAENTKDLIHRMRQ